MKDSAPQVGDFAPPTPVLPTQKLKISLKDFAARRGKQEKMEKADGVRGDSVGWEKVGDAMKVVNEAGEGTREVEDVLKSSNQWSNLTWRRCF